MEALGLSTVGQPCAPACKAEEVKSSTLYEAEGTRASSTLQCTGGLQPKHGLDLSNSVLRANPKKIELS